MADDMRATDNLAEITKSPEALEKAANEFALFCEAQGVSGPVEPEFANALFLADRRTDILWLRGLLAKTAENDHETRRDLLARLSLAEERYRNMGSDPKNI